jgi:tRNA(fMet)-specific endonuclease VapC
VNKTYMLDTNICSFIMREQPEAVLKRLEQAVLRNHRIVVSAITYSEMRFGSTGEGLPRHVQLVDAFCSRLDAVLPWTARRSTPPRKSGGAAPRRDADWPE